MRNLDQFVRSRTASFIERRGKTISYLRYQRGTGPNPTATLLGKTFVKAMVLPYPVNLINGTTVLNKDVMVQIAATKLPFTPALIDVLEFDGKRYSIITVSAENALETVAKWTFQARGSS